MLLTNHTSHEHALCILTLTPSPGCSVMVKDFFKGPFISKASITSYLCNTLTMKKLASFKAYCSVPSQPPTLPYNEHHQQPSGDSRPMHTRGPPLNPRKSQPSLRPSQRSGLKTSAFSPQMSLRRCMAYAE